MTRRSSFRYTRSVTLVLPWPTKCAISSIVTPELDSKDTKLVTDCIDAGIFRAEDPTHIGGVLWAATHGAVSLELAGYEGPVDAQRRFDELCAAAAAWFMVSTSHSPRRDRVWQRMPGTTTGA
jgi:Tetracyclin repressor-like, C-terminal domain